MANDEIIKLGKELLAYADKFNLPLPYIFEILEDQKVTPMIRGKAMEYNAYLLLEQLLSKKEWSVQKLNLNAQPGIHDEDISITHRRTGVILKVESKSAVRGSIKHNKSTRNPERKDVPGFCVKCHRSRSNIKLAKTSNDKYHVSSFDIIVTNVSNAIFQGATVGESLEIVHDKSIREMLLSYYNVKTEKDLRHATENDWRFCIPSDIAIDEFIPRTPYVKLKDDPNWRPIRALETRLLEVVTERKKNQTASRR